MLSPPGRGDTAFGFELMRQPNRGDTRSQRDCDTRSHWVTCPCPVQDNSLSEPRLGHPCEARSTACPQGHLCPLSMGPHSAAVTLGCRVQETQGLLRSSHAGLGRAVGHTLGEVPLPASASQMERGGSDRRNNLLQAPHQEANPGLWDPEPVPWAPTVPAQTPSLSPGPRISSGR